MITKVIMPQMSLTMQIGLVATWLKRVGDVVKEGEPICTVEGDKATIDIEAPAAGILLKIIAKEGEEFPVKEVMAYIGEPGDVVELDDKPGEQTSAAVKESKSSVEKSTTSTKRGDRKLVSPVARRLAQEKNIDLSQIIGTGPEGRITKQDVLAFDSGNQAASSAATSEKVRELTSIEKIVAERMAESNREIPHFHISISCNISEANKLRKEFNNRDNANESISITDMITWAVSRELQNHPTLNSSFNNNQVIEHNDVNIGLAVDTVKGLLVVVIKDAADKPISEIAEQRQSLTKRALDGHQTVDDISGGTFTITNLGMFGIEAFDPIISPGQVAILSIGMLKNVFELDSDGAIKTFEQISMTLGCDHRAVNGVAGAKFLADLKARLSNPSSMFM